MKSSTRSYKPQERVKERKIHLITRVSSLGPSCEAKWNFRQVARARGIMNFYCDACESGAKQEKNMKKKDKGQVYTGAAL